MPRPDVRQVQKAFRGPLEEFVRETGVRLAALINRGGQVLAYHGFDRVFDLVGVATLAAGINASSQALAQQLGEDQFEHVYHAGRVRQLFLGHFDSPAGRLMLVAVFDEHSSIGLVRVFFDDLAAQVREMHALDIARSAESARAFDAELEARLEAWFRRT